MPEPRRWHSSPNFPTSWERIVRRTPRPLRASCARPRCPTSRHRSTAFRSHHARPDANRTANARRRRRPRTMSADGNQIRIVRPPPRRTTAGDVGGRELRSMRIASTPDAFRMTPIVEIRSRRGSRDRRSLPPRGPRSGREVIFVLKNYTRKKGEAMSFSEYPTFLAFKERIESCGDCPR